MSRVAIVGAGAWGTALAIARARKDQSEVRLWAFEAEVCDSINTRHVNEMYLPGMPIPASVRATSNLAEALQGAEIVVSVMPSPHVRRAFTQMASLLPPETLVVSATKGIEEGTLLRMTEVAVEVLRAARPGSEPRIGALSGPSFAKEVARGDPTAVTVASRDAELASRIQREFSDSNLRIYTHDDVVGVELGGALKNVIAIAAGVCDGLGLGHNSIAALITRGLAEITRLAVACGGRRETMSGLAGMGDLVLTCTGALSRNRTVGVELGRGRKLEEILAGMHGAVAEGIFTIQAALGLAKKHGVEMPISQQMDLILHQGKSPKDAIRELMMRPGKEESA